MEDFSNFVGAIGSFIWGPVMLVLLLGTGFYLTIGLRGMTFARIGYAFRMMWKGRSAEEGHEGQITPFNALSTALAATIGTGNIAGVATAIYLGGPGAVFWMWITALVGMATKYGEAVLAVKYREVDEAGNYVGGPMYYIKNGLGENWKWLGFLFAFFGMFAAFGIGNAIQANSVAQAANDHFSVPLWLTAIVLAVLTFLVIIGGIKRLGEVAGKAVPIMAVLYVAGALIIIIVNIDKLPAAIGLIVGDAFTGTAATGGFAGAGIMAAIRFGVARGIFSNEAGLGTAPIAHAAAQTNDPVRQGTIGMLGTFIDTIIVCSMTALVIIMTGAWTSGATGASLSTAAFNTGLPGFGKIVVVFGILIFAYTTLLSWSYYGERCAEYIFGIKVIQPYRIFWIIVIFVGALGKEQLELLWLIADTLNGMMAIPNLIALLLLSPIIFKITRDYFSNQGGSGGGIE
ncbi:MAG: sodium:alanine symporter family protein [Rhodospirillales bacterium]|nr:sodium:alanine symporter family protein [Rhodospirillales bacterium]